MKIEKLYFKQKRSMGLDTASLLAEYEAQMESSPEECESLAEKAPEEYAAGLETFRKLVEKMDRLEQEHPRVENPRLRQQFETLVNFALEIAEVFGLDICAEIDHELCGRLTLIGDSLLLRREYDFNGLPLMKVLMGMCEQFYAVPIEKYGCTLMHFSFIIPLYDRKNQTA